MSTEPISIDLETVVNKMNTLYPQQLQHAFSECKADLLEQRLSEASQVIESLMAESGNDNEQDAQ